MRCNVTILTQKCYGIATAAYGLLAMTSFFTTLFAVSLYQKNRPFSRLAVRYYCGKINPKGGMEHDVLSLLTDSGNHYAGAQKTGILW